MSFCPCCGRANGRNDLSSRERATLYWVIRGKTSQEIAKKMSRSLGTARHTIHRVHQKLGTRTREELIEVGTEYLDRKDELRSSRAIQVDRIESPAIAGDVRMNQRSTDECRQQRVSVCCLGTDK